MNNLVNCEQKQQTSITPSLGKRIDHLFGDFFSNFDNSIFKHHHNTKELKVNVSEDTEAYYVEAALAGFGKENVKVDCKHNVLSIEAKKEENKEESKKNYHCVECHYGSFFRNFQLPENINTNKIVADMKDGLLKITLPKSEEKSSTGTGVTIR